MADSGVHKQDYSVEDLDTKLVTLSPHTATVERNINDVFLQPGSNEITLYGLTPTTEEHSLQISGQGAALITDMTVECVPNHDILDVGDSSDSDTSDDNKESPEGAYQSNEHVKKLDAKIDELRRQVADAEEEINITVIKIGVLDEYGKTLHSKESTPSTLAEYLHLYGKERRDLYHINKSSTLKMEQLREQIHETSLQRTKIWNSMKKAEKKASKEKMKEAYKKTQSREKRRAEKRRLKEQRLAFWPKNVYKVVVCLEASPDDVIAVNHLDDKEVQKKSSSKSSTMAERSLPISLSFSYVTRSAGWYPAYNVQLFTPSRSGTIAYRAEFVNGTSETWRNAKVTLSTSQTSFSGLVDTIPKMMPWHVRLVKHGAAFSNANQPFGNATPVNAWDGGLESQREKNEKVMKHLAGPAAGVNRGGGLFGNRADARQPAQSAMFGGGVPPSGLGLFGRTSVEATAGFGSNNHSQQQQQTASQQQSLQQRYSSHPTLAVMSREARDDNGNERGGGHEPAVSGPQDDASILSADTITGAVAFQESSREDQGLTTTFSLSGTRTLAPSHLKRRHLIADLSLTSITLSYELIPKLRAAAFLRARVRNTSPVTLLRGRASLTLDGTFLGNTTIPRASPDETFTLFLGIDPAIHVGYAKPTVRRSSSGIFNREESVVYTRVTTVTNTKSQNEAVELVVTDQIPVSEDEQLRMAILQPAGLKNEGDRVKTGEGVTGSKWGKAIATLKKNGEVTWNVTLNKGASCRLTLEYEAKIPASEIIVGLS